MKSVTKLGSYYLIVKVDLPKLDVYRFTLPQVVKKRLETTLQECPPLVPGGEVRVLGVSWEENEG